MRAPPSAGPPRGATSCRSTSRYRSRAPGDTRHERFEAVVRGGDAAHPRRREQPRARLQGCRRRAVLRRAGRGRSEEHTSELQSLAYLVCRLLLEKKKKKTLE